MMDEEHPEFEAGISRKIQMAGQVCLRCAAQKVLENDIRKGEVPLVVVQMEADDTGRGLGCIYN